MGWKWWNMRSVQKKPMILSAKANTGVIRILQNRPAAILCSSITAKKFGWRTSGSNNCNQQITKPVKKNAGLCSGGLLFRKRESMFSMITGFDHWSCSLSIALLLDASLMSVLKFSNATITPCWGPDRFFILLFFTCIPLLLKAYTPVATLST